VALSSRELYLVLRAKNDADRALNSISRSMGKFGKQAELAAQQARKAHLAAEQATARHNKAIQEFAHNQLLAQKAVLRQAEATQRGEQATLAYATGMLTARKAAQNHTRAVLESEQAIDRQRIGVLRSEQAFNKLRIANIRSAGGDAQLIANIRARNRQVQEEIIHVNDLVLARQGDINAIRQQIDQTEKQIQTAKREAQNRKAALLNTQQAIREKQKEIDASRESAAQIRKEIADREKAIKAVQREIAATKEANRQRQESAQRLRDQGNAMAATGTAMVAVGAGTLAAMWQLTQAAVQYEKQTALTKTQVDDQAVSLEHLKKVGLDVAKEFGVGFDQIQDAFFDIFSSMDVNLPQATLLLKNFAKAAIAGNTDIKTAGATTIGVLNAFQIPAEKVNRVLDIQFRLVKEGRVSYEELARSLGRATPSAVRAGQSFETLAGIMAYLTRKNLTPYNAVSSAGRALDLFSNSKVGERLEKMGIQVRDAAGRFRPMADVILELQKRLSTLDPAARAKAIDELFKGSGNNIQARRFWDFALANEKEAKAFADMVNRMKGATGDLDQKYGQMADTMAVRSQKVANQWQVLKVRLGETLFPALETLLTWLGKVADWLDKLSPGQRKFLAWAVVIGAALTVLLGTLALIVGSLLVLAAGFAAVGGAAVAWVAGIALVIGALVLAYAKVDWFREGVNTAWEWIKNASIWLWENGIKPAFQGIWTVIKQTWERIKITFNAWRSAVSQTLIPLMMTLYTEVIKPVWSAISTAISFAWNSVIKPVWNAIVSVIRNVLAPIVKWLGENVFRHTWQVIQVVVQTAWAVLKVIFGMIQIAIKAVATVVRWLWNTVWKPVWEAVGNVINYIWATKIKPVLNALVDGFNKHVSPALRSLGKLFSTVWDSIAKAAKTPIRFVVVTVLNNGLLAAYNKLADLFDVKPDNVRIPLPKGFARGGRVWGPGTPTSDSIPAMLSNGEHVWTAEEVRKAGGHRAVERLREQARRHQALYARGGPVLSPSGVAGVGRDVTVRRGPGAGPLDWVKDAVANFTPSKALEKALGLVDRIPGAKKLREVVVNSGKKVIRGAVEWIKDKVLEGLPGGGPKNLGGPSGSSVAAILGVARRFYAGAALSSGYRPGDPGYHGRGLAADLIGGGASGMARIARGFYGISGRLLELIHSGGGGFFVKNGSRVGSAYYASEIPAHFNHVHVAANRNALMDTGGLLQPGLTTVLNSTGRAERVLSAAQTRSFDRLVQLLDGQRQYNVSGLVPDGGFGRSQSRPIQITIYTQEIDPRRHAVLLGQELDRQIGAG
jgi:TP901 family phage tail tape measure protein